MLFRATASTARGKFAVDHHGGHATNTVNLGFDNCLGLLRVVDYDFVRRASKPLDQFN
jgi:hypothetical protein